MHIACRTNKQTKVVTDLVLRLREPGVVESIMSDLAKYCNLDHVFSCGSPSCLGGHLAVRPETRELFSYDRFALDNYGDCPLYFKDFTPDRAGLWRQSRTAWQIFPEMLAASLVGVECRYRDYGLFNALEEFVQQEASNLLVDGKPDKHLCFVAVRLAHYCLLDTEQINTPLVDDDATLSFMAGVVEYAKSLLLVANRAPLQRLRRKKHGCISLP